MTLRRITPLLALLAVCAVAACETVKGAGRDIQGAGHAVSTGAAEVQDDLQ